MAAVGYELPVRNVRNIEFPDKDVNPVAYLLNYVLPSGDYIKAYNVNSDMASVSYNLPAS